MKSLKRKAPTNGKLDTYKPPDYETMQVDGADHPYFAKADVGHTCTVPMKVRKSAESKNENGHKITLEMMGMDAPESMEEKDESTAKQKAEGKKGEAKETIGKVTKAFVRKQGYKA